MQDNFGATLCDAGWFTPGQRRENCCESSYSRSQLPTLIRDLLERWWPVDSTARRISSEHPRSSTTPQLESSYPEVPSSEAIQRKSFATEDDAPSVSCSVANLKEARRTAVS